MPFNLNNCCKKVYLVAESSICFKVPASVSKQVCFVQACWLQPRKTVTCMHILWRKYLEGLKEQLCWSYFIKFLEWQPQLIY